MQNWNVIGLLNSQARKNAGMFSKLTGENDAHKKETDYWFSTKLQSDDIGKMGRQKAGCWC